MRKQGVHQFVALDSCRGLCACMVVLFHFKFKSYSHFHFSGLVENSYLFVDFFFVLSGFIITAAYRDRFLRGASVVSFLLLRLGRLWPLHLAMLGAYLALEIAYALVLRDTGLVGTRPAFEGTYSGPALISNFFLVHSLGWQTHNTWNTPSWSISTEFWTYVLFALAMMTLRRKLWIAAVGGIGAGIYILTVFSKGNMDVSVDYGMARCVAGFGAGVLTYYAYERLARLPWVEALAPWKVGIAEGLGVLWAVVFVALSVGTPFAVWAGPVFALTILVFAFDKGTLSKGLARPAFTFVGKLSYSIYMIHFFIIYWIANAAAAAAKVTGLPIMAEVETAAGTRRLIGPTLWMGDLATLAVLGIVIAVSALTYRWVEKPARDWTRVMVKRREAARAGPSQGAAAPVGIRSAE